MSISVALLCRYHWHHCVDISGITVLISVACTGIIESISVACTGIIESMSVALQPIELQWTLYILDTVTDLHWKTEYYIKRSIFISSILYSSYGSSDDFNGKRTRTKRYLV